MSDINTMTRQKQTVKLAKMGMLVAISIVLVAFIHFPIIPAVPFMEYDPADIPILIGAFAFGPAAGLALTAVTAVIQGVTVSAGSGIYGIIMHLVATGALVATASIIYSRHKTRKGAIIAVIAGTLAMAAVMVPCNLIVTPIFMGAPRSAVVALIPAIIAFNLVKAGINSAVTFLLYKKISGFLHK
ncbi:MAG: ECF transporter S component [Eubacteriaceae bacterium]|nr:ECF transporter S component [Eubacteriaceae bacterium]